MNTQRRTAGEQYQLIMECRNSGLSDYQCKCQALFTSLGKVIFTKINFQKSFGRLIWEMKIRNKVPLFNLKTRKMHITAWNGRVYALKRSNSVN